MLNLKKIKNRAISAFTHKGLDKNKTHSIKGGTEPTFKHKVIVKQEESGTIIK